VHFFFYPFFKLYEIIFPDARRFRHRTVRFILFALLILGFIISGAVYAAVAQWP